MSELDKWNDIRLIFDSLQDERSRFIFEKRLLYSLSQDHRYIDELVLEEMKYYGNKDILNRVKEWLGSGEREWKKLWIFGSGFAGKQVSHILKLNGYAVSGILDNNSSFYDQMWDGIQITYPDVVSSGDAVIIGTNSSHEEIKNQLLALGINCENIYVPDGLWWLGNQKQYFDYGIIAPSEHEIFVDGGALDGEDSQNFIEWCNCRYESIHAFEPDKFNYEIIKKNTKFLKNCFIHNVGLWSRKDEMKFFAGIMANCTVSENGNTVVEVDSIDEALNGEAVTLIKMDIEGCELAAICGAAETIRKHKPKLAICIYHKPEDIILILNKILELNPDYKFFLRHYSYLETETVLYAK